MGPNQTVELTASRRAADFSMTKPLSFELHSLSLAAAHSVSLDPCATPAF